MAFQHGVGVNVCFSHHHDQMPNKKQLREGFTFTHFDGVIYYEREGMTVGASHVCDSKNIKLPFQILADQKTGRA